METLERRAQLRTGRNKLPRGRKDVRHPTEEGQGDSPRSERSPAGSGSVSNADPAATSWKVNVKSKSQAEELCSYYEACMEFVCFHLMVLFCYPGPTL